MVSDRLLLSRHRRRDLIFLRRLGLLRSVPLLRRLLRLRSLTLLRNGRRRNEGERYRLYVISLATASYLHGGQQTMTASAHSQGYKKPARTELSEKYSIREQSTGPEYLLVDGYNIIFAWEDLAQQARADLDAARRQLCDALSSFAGFTKCRLVVVFDGYKLKGNPGEKSQFHNIQVVYTKEGETADAYIEALANDIGGNYAVRVASSDNLVQLSSFRSGVLRMSARELREEVEAARKEMGKHFRK